MTDIISQILTKGCREMSAEDLLFNISCLDESKKCEVGDTIYYIADFISDPETDGGTIWKIKSDGSQNAPLSVGGQQNEASEISSVDDRWIYYIDTDDEARKINLLGYMDQEA